MVKYLLIPFLLIIGLHTVKAQREGNFWVFGDSVGLDFNSSPPTVVEMRNKMTHGLGHECYTSICNADGQLQFYFIGGTDTTIFTGPPFGHGTLYLPDGSIMPNGDSINSHFSIGQGAIVLPSSTKDEYLLFTVKAQQYINNQMKGKLYLTIIHGDAVNGYVVSEKNVPVSNLNIAESIAAIRSSDGKKWWLVAHEELTRNFLVWEIDNKNFNKTPQKYSSGKIHNCGECMMTQTSFSWSGKFLIETARDGLAEVFSFDRCHGTVGGLIYSFDYGTGAFALDTVVNGAMLSENDSLLYISYEKWSNTTGYIIQIPIYSKNPIIRIIDKHQHNPTTSYGKLVVAPDKKIYTVILGFEEQYYRFLHTISNSNGIGLNCNFSRNALSLNNHTSGAGLPNLPYYHHKVDTVFSDYITHRSCLDMAPTITATSGLSYQWNTGDTTRTIPLRTYGLHTCFVSTECGIVVDRFIVKESCELFIPNVFTPNGDGVNDVWPSEDFIGTIQVFSRYGQKLYEGAKPWNAEGATAGVYYYVIHSPQYEQSKSGYLTVVK